MAGPHRRTPTPPPSRPPLRRRGLEYRCSSKIACDPAIVRQQSEKMTEVAAWCTWGRIKAFRAMTAAVLAIGAALAGIPVVIVSDGAPWIRKMRRWIPCLKDAIWILDWFHLKDHLLKCLSAFNIEEASEIAQTLINLLWRGDAE